MILSSVGRGSLIKYGGVYHLVTADQTEDKIKIVNAYSGVSWLYKGLHVEVLYPAAIFLKDAEVNKNYLIGVMKVVVRKLENGQKIAVFLSTGEVTCSPLLELNNVRGDRQTVETVGNCSGRFEEM